MNTRTKPLEDIELTDLQGAESNKLMSMLRSSKMRPIDVGSTKLPQREVEFVIGAKVEYRFGGGLIGEVIGYNPPPKSGSIPSDQAAVVVRHDDGRVVEYSFKEIRLQPLPYKAGVLVKV